MQDGVSIGFKLPNCGGVLCPPEWATPATIHDLAAEADAAGFDAVWLHDHQVTPRELRDLGALRFYEPLITMATLAQAYPRLTIGVATIVLPLRDPVLLAKQVSTLDGFFPHRFVFGLGAGRYESEFQAVGLDTFGTRGRVSKESLEIIRALRTEDPVTYEGTGRTLSDVSMHPQADAASRSPIWYAGNASVGARRAARLADGWIGASIDPAEFEALVTEVLDARDAAQMPRDGFGIAVSATVVRPRAEEPRADEPALHRHRAAITGSDSEVVDQLNAYIARGARHLLLSLRADDLDTLHDDLAWFSTAVMPRLHRAAHLDDAMTAHAHGKVG